MTPKSHRVPACAVVVLGILLALLTTPVQAQAKRPREEFEPPDGKALVLIGGEWHDEVGTYRKLTGDTPAGTKLWYEFVDAKCDYFLHCARNNCPPGGILFVESVLANITKGDLRPYIRGDFDDRIIALGKEIKSCGKPVFFGIGGEFDHPDKGWPNRYTPEEFVAAYRHIHDLWASKGVANVAYVWHTSNLGPESLQKEFDRRDLGETMRFWPGDDYVDWIGASVYWPEQFDRLRLVADLARRKGKPLMVAEGSFASMDGRGPRSYEEWHGPFLALCERARVKAIAYNNFNDFPTLGIFKDSNFDKLPKDVSRKWGQAMKRSFYMHASPELYERIGFVAGQSVLVAGGAPGPGNKAIEPSESLLNGKDLAGWRAIVKDGDAQAEDEFSITTTGVLALRGRHEGYLRTEKSYGDLVLSFEWRFPKNGKMTGSGSGVLLGLGEEDGWLSHGFEVQIASRNCGDLWVYDGYRFDGQATEGRFGRVQKMVGAEKPIGEWNTYEVRCEGRRIRITLNGKVVNEATSDRPISGKIGLISQGTEIEFRDFRLKQGRR